MTRVETISELVVYDEDKNEVILVDWKKFSELEKSARNIKFEIAEKADRELAKCILYLCRTKILSKFLEDTYVITTENANKRLILPIRDEIKYGFTKKEDAEKYAQIKYPKIYDNLIITHQNDIFDLEEAFNSDES